MKRFYSTLSALALLVFPFSILVLDHISGLILIVVILTGLLLIGMNFRESIEAIKREKLFFIATGLLLFSALLTALITQTDLARGDRFFAFVLVIPVYFFFLKVPPENRFLWTGLVIGSIVAAVVGAYQVFGPPALQRATGTIHPILFGDLSLLMGLLSFAGLMWFIQHRQWLIVIPLLAVITGLIASALSLSRGGWVAIPVAVLIYVWFYAQYFSRKTLITVFLLLMSTLATIYLVPETGVQKRVEKTFTNINRYYHSENTNDPARHSSIGARFEMWRSAWNMFLENPVLGGGWGEFQNYNQKYIKEGKVNKVAGKFYHAHNQYISILAKGGVISFISLLFLFFVPALLFYRIIKGSSQTDVKSYALAGLIIIAAYAGFALSEAILERSRPVIFFSFYLAVFMAATRKRNLNPEATN